MAYKGEGLEVIHGRIRTYQLGCRCGLCRRENTDQHRAYVQRRRSSGGMPMRADRQTQRKPGLSPLSRSEAGRMGAAVRWGPEPRLVRIDDLGVEARRRVVAFVASERTGGVRSVVHTYKGEGLTTCGLEVVGPCPDCAEVVT